MACIVYMTNKKSGHVYAYESVSYRDPITKVPKSKRKYLGRVDPVTKEFLKEPVKKDSSSPGKESMNPGEANDTPYDDTALKAELEKLQEDMKCLKDEVARLRQAQAETQAFLTNIGQSIQQFTVSHR